MAVLPSSYTLFPVRCLMFKRSSFLPSKGFPIGGKWCTKIYYFSFLRCSFRPLSRERSPLDTSSIVNLSSALLLKIRREVGRTEEKRGRGSRSHTNLSCSPFTYVLKQFSDPILQLHGGCNFFLCRQSTAVHEPMWNFLVFRSSSNSQSPLLSSPLPLFPLDPRFIRFLSHRMENGDVVRKAFSVARSLCTPRAFVSFINRLQCWPTSLFVRLLT